MRFPALRSLFGKFILPALVIGSLIIACKKNNSTTPAKIVTPVTPISTTPNLNDTVFNYAKFWYYWNENVPTTFNYNNYTLYIAAQDSSPLVESIKLYSPLNSVNNLHYDHFSFLLTETQYNQIFNGTGGAASFGMNFAQDRNGNYRVSYIPHGAPAYLQGVRRGWQLDAINGIALTPNLSAATAAQLNNILSNDASASFQFTTPASPNPVTLTLTTGSYSDDEVIATTSVTSGNQVIGYMAYNTFVTPTDKNGNPTHPGLDTAFAYLQAKGVTDLIIDLRYNGGGYTEVAEELDNAILPSSANGQILDMEKWDDSLNLYHKAYPGYGIPADTTIYVNKTKATNPPGLKINNVVFIVSNETVSASELTINNLKPYFANMKLVGLGKSFPSNQQNTAGKPFGFLNYGFPLPTATSVPQYELFLINFETKNALGQDNYISGFTPDVQEYDGLEYNWGDPNEDGYKAAFNFLTKGSFALGNTKSSLALGKNSVSSLGGSFLGKMHGTGVHFKGMIPSVLRTRIQKGGANTIKKAQILYKLSGKSNSQIR
jgi:C-terminal processing protease CtpA/Prc